MLSAAVLALTSATAFAKTPFVKYETGNNILEYPKYFTLSYLADFDASYGTKYYGGQDDEGDNQRGMGLHLTSEGTLTLTGIFMDSYVQTATLTVNLFDIVPYGQIVWWSPMDGSGTGTKGTDGIRAVDALFDISLTYTDTTKTYYGSATDGSYADPSYTYDYSSVGEVEDKYVQFHPFADQDWYGQHDWWTT